MESLPVVLLHGIRLTGSMWQPQLDRLTHPEYALAPDLPGHGERHAEQFTMDSAADAAAEAIDQLGGRALVVGLSLGGYVAIATAARHPTAVAGVLAMSCSAVPNVRRAKPYQLLGKLSSGPGQALQRRLLKIRVGRHAASAATEGGLYMAVVPDVVSAVTTFDPLAALTSFPGPVWIMNGVRDPFTIDANRFVAACQQGQLVNIPKAGHLVNLTHPQRTTELIESAAQRMSSD